MHDGFLIERCRAIFIVTRDRPACRDSLHQAPHQALAATFDTLAGEDRVRVVIPTGTEDVGFSEDGQAVFAALDGKFDRDEAIPCQIDGGVTHNLGGVPDQGTAAICVPGLMN